MPETLYFPLGRDRGKAARCLGRDRVLPLLAAECQLPGPQGEARWPPAPSLPFRDGAPFPAASIFSGAEKRRSDSQARHPDKQPIRLRGCSGLAELCDLMDCSPPGSSVHRMFQPRILEWVAILSSRGSSWPGDGTRVSCIGCIGSSPLGHLGSRSYPALVSEDGAVAGPQSGQSCGCSQRGHRRTHLGKPRAALWCRVSPLAGGLLGSPPRSPFGGPPLSPGASSIAGARKRRGTEVWETLSPSGLLSPAPATRWLSQPGQGTES